MTLAIATGYDLSFTVCIADALKTEPICSRQYNPGGRGCKCEAPTPRRHEAQGFDAAMINKRADSG